ncbi:unnamed protein product [Symbiodinium natans]|uniref:Uncharacterized protein n=1 Tax=Symbiodinium natans TaxID=878477 RepID=A0A812KDM2_9DINO|nr:unnamed protein product [Symbiodinium natans]
MQYAHMFGSRPVDVPAVIAQEAQLVWNVLPICIRAAERNYFARPLVAIQRTRQETVAWLRVLLQEIELHDAQRQDIIFWMTVPYLSLPSSCSGQVLEFLFPSVLPTTSVELVLQSPSWILSDSDDDDVEFDDLRHDENFEALKSRSEQERKLLDQVQQMCGEFMCSNIRACGHIHFLRHRQTIWPVSVRETAVRWSL